LSRHNNNYSKELLEEISSLTAKDIVPVEKQGFYVYYEGVITNPEANIPETAPYRRFYINGKIVDDPVLLRSFQAGYSEHGLKSENASCVLSLDIKHYRLDEITKNGVNTVNFYDPTNVGNFCKDAVIEALSRM
jgi:DNA mismatch repair ATPase MutL